jgi:hypothetical protein
VNDADSDPTNELQDWASLPGIPGGFADGTDDVDDGDTDPANELQTWGSLPGIPAGFADGTDDVIDADSSTTNELQSLSLASNTLSISGGNSVPLPPDDDWVSSGANVTNTTDSIGIGTSSPGYRLEVRGGGGAGGIASVSNISVSFNSFALRGESPNGPTRGYLGVQGGSGSFDAITYSFPVEGSEIGVLGMSTGASSTDNWGVLGVSNGWGGRFEHVGGNFVELGGSGRAIRIVDGNEGEDRILTSDANGFATWEAPLWEGQLLEVRAMPLVDVFSGGDFITASTNGVINAGGVVYPTGNAIGDGAPTPSVAVGDEDLWIDGDLEVVGLALKSGGGSWIAISDRRLKRDIVPYEDGLAQVLQIDPVWFRYTDRIPSAGDRRFVGVVAQDMLEVAPYTVEEHMAFRRERETEDGGIEVLEPGEPLYTYDGTAVTYMLVNAVQEQQATIQSLQAENDTLQGQLRDLLGRVAALEAGRR